MAWSNLLSRLCFNTRVHLTAHSGDLAGFSLPLLFLYPVPCPVCVFLFHHVQVGCGRLCCEGERMGLHCDWGSCLLLTVKVPGCKPHPFSILPWTLDSLPCPHWASPGRSPFTSPPADFPDIHRLWELPGHLAQGFPGSDLTGQQGL